MRCIRNTRSTSTSQSIGDTSKYIWIFQRITCQANSVNSANSVQIANKHPYSKMCQNCGIGGKCQKCKISKVSKLKKTVLNRIKVEVEVGDFSNCALVWRLHCSCQLCISVVKNTLRWAPVSFSQCLAVELWKGLMRIMSMHCVAVQSTVFNMLCMSSVHSQVPCKCNW